MEITVPTDDRVKACALLKAAVGDPINEAILQYILANKTGYLGELSRDLTRRHVGSRMSIYQRLTSLVDIGILTTSTVQVPEAIPRVSVWVKEYRLAPAHAVWISRLLGR